MIKIKKIHNKSIQLLKEAEKYEKKDTKKSLDCSKEALKIIKENKLLDLEAMAFLRLGRAYWIQGKLEEALDYLNKGLVVNKNIENHLIQAELLNAIGNVNTYMDIYDQAINYYMKALDIVEDQDINELKAGIYNNIGTIFSRLDSNSDAIHYYNLGIKIAIQSNDEYVLTVLRYNLTEAYYREKKFKKAKSIIDIICKNVKKDESKTLYSKAIHLLGLIEFELGQKERAIDLIKESLSITEKTNEHGAKIDALIDLANCLAKQNKYEEAIKYMNYTNIKEDDFKYGNQILEIYQKLGEYNNSIDKKEEANKYFKKYVYISKDIYKFKKKEKARTIKLQIQFRKKENETKLYKELSEELKNKSTLLSKSYKEIKAVSEIGAKITAKLEIDNIFEDLYHDISSLMDISVLGIGIYKEDELRYDLYIENGKKLPVHSIKLDMDTSLAAYSINKDEPIMINDLYKEYHKYIKEPSATIGENMNSIIYIPLKVEDNLIGVITVQSKHKNIYDQNDFIIVKTLSAYIAVAINNSNKNKKLKKEIEDRNKAESNLKKLNNKLTKLSEVDGLTKVANRRYIDLKLKKDWLYCREHKKPVTILLIDIDYFKEYNDFYGHLKGDEVLKLVGKLLKDIMKEYNYDYTVGRYGGDEFIIIIPEVDSIKGIEFAKEIMKSIKEENIQHVKSSILKRVSLSVGVSTLIPSDEDYKILINKADNALYKSKRAGRNEITYQE